ncbi:MAG: hypothetical protein QOJ89_2180, partial [bacterium]
MPVQPKAQGCARLFSATLMASIAVCALPSLAAASSRSEAALRAYETRALGAAHAAEHAEARREERVLVRKARASRATRPVVPRVAGPAASVGAWNRQRGGPFQMPAVAIHSVLLPTGKVLLWGRPPGDAGAPTDGYAWLWDPTTDVRTRVDPPNITHPDGQIKPANIWCAGQTSLGDGTVLVAGGNLADPTSASDWKGLNAVFTFNPFTETWTRQPDMRHGRWYPTNLELPDGRAVIMSGYDETGTTTTNKDIELFKPGLGQGTISLLGTRGGTGQPPDGGLYPHMFWMRDGRALVAGPNNNDTWYMTPSADGTSFSWTDAANMSRSRLWGNAVLLPGGPTGSSKIMEIGGANASLAAPDTEIFDATTGSWSTGPSQSIGRGHANTVQLPDGSMVTVGGGVGQGSTGLYDATPEQKQVELYDPATGTWRLGAAQDERRAYHSTALLLPDGRVLSAGDDGAETGVTNSGRYLDDGEIYEPPYLFNSDGSLATRPQITQSPTSVKWGTSFAVHSPDTDITRAVLLAPGAVTHGNDMHQRPVDLALGQSVPGTGLNLVSPPSPDVAPPGYYMLFLINSHGVPSVARFIRLDPAAPDPEVLSAPDTTPPSVSVTAPAQGATVSGTVNVSATASDNAAVSSVQFKLDGNDLGAADTTSPYSVTWDATTATLGSHTITAVARDAASNSATSSPVTVTVSATVPGLVGAYGFEETSGTTATDSSGTGNAGTITGA